MTRLTAARMSALRIIIESDGSTGGQIAQAARGFFRLIEEVFVFVGEVFFGGWDVELDA